MLFNKNGSVLLDKDEAMALEIMAENMLKVADLNELKTQGFVTICDTFIDTEIVLLLNLAKPDR